MTNTNECIMKEKIILILFVEKYLPVPHTVSFTLCLHLIDIYYNNTRTYTVYTVYIRFAQKSIFGKLN